MDLTTSDFWKGSESQETKYSHNSWENHALEEIAKQLWISRADILPANELDMTAAKGKIQMWCWTRLYLDEEQLLPMAEWHSPVDWLGGSCRAESWKDWAVTDLSSVKAVAMGVIGIIYGAGLTLPLTLRPGSKMSGSAVVQKRKDAHQTALAIVTALKKNGLAQTNFARLYPVGFWYQVGSRLLADERPRAIVFAHSSWECWTDPGGCGECDCASYRNRYWNVHIYVDKDLDQR